MHLIPYCTLYYHRSDPRNPPISVIRFFLLLTNISSSSIRLLFFFSSFLLSLFLFLSYPYPLYTVYTLFLLIQFVNSHPSYLSFS